MYKVTWNSPRDVDLMRLRGISAIGRIWRLEEVLGFKLQSIARRRAISGNPVVFIRFTKERGLISPRRQRPSRAAEHSLTSQQISPRRLFDTTEDSQSSNVSSYPRDLGQQRYTCIGENPVLERPEPFLSETWTSTPIQEDLGSTDTMDRRQFSSMTSLDPVFDYSIFSSSAIDTQWTSLSREVSQDGYQSAFTLPATSPSTNGTPTQDLYMLGPYEDE